MQELAEYMGLAKLNERLKDPYVKKCHKLYPIPTYPIPSYPILSYPNLSHPILSYPILPHPIILFHYILIPILSYLSKFSYCIAFSSILSYPILPSLNHLLSYLNPSHPVLSWCILSCDVSYPVLLYPILSCFILSCPALSYPVLWCFIDIFVTGPFRCTLRDFSRVTIHVTRALPSIFLQQLDLAGSRTYKVCKI